MPDQQQSLIKLDESISAKIAEYVPKMEAGSAKALAALQAKHELLKTAIEGYDGSPNETVDAAVETATSTLTAAKTAYDKWNEWRTEITKPLDEFKAKIMEFERVVNPDGKTDNYYTKVRRLIVDVQNKKNSYKETKEKEAKAKKDLENYKVDLGTEIKKALATMLIDRVKDVDAVSRKFFDDTPLEKFDERANVYKSTKPKLKKEHYDACFVIAFSPIKITKAQYDEFVEALKQEETYEKWDAAYNETVTPTVNEWRAKIPSIKEQKLAIANAPTEEAKTELVQQAQEQAAAETEQKNEELNQLAQEVAADIESEGTMNKMQNEFVEQVSTQSLDTAPTKKVYVVKDDKLFVKALCNAVYHAMSNPNFPGIYKRDKMKKVVIDPDTNEPQIMEHAKWFFDFVATNCDVALEGMEIKRIAKVSIRK